ncbi:hypothetical protein [Mucilaginibacter jinjuensis]|uniref:Uncharacterized protein n=1 Tax=Mucilaginibacter jinjuensis TaxID=1176721 RepID=A0ABY7TBP6_9SPHI|nr:hypothetical protein [Mucilaginibacter jinjuensis]WCT13386.1 hypothetical protein PQO05_05490 [Mucilaginibacter jinjuensis]
MGQLLRITFNQKDYIFQILNPKPLSKTDQEIQVLINDVTTTLIRDTNGWSSKEEADTENKELFKAIGMAISLRYRI